MPRPASACDSGATISAKCRPTRSSAVQPNSCSAPSAMNVKRPSASLRQMTSGVAWTRLRKLVSDASSRASRSEFERAMAAWSASAWSIPSRSGEIEPGFR